VVVVVREHFDNPGWTGETGARSDEDTLDAGSDEPIDEILREAAVDLVGTLRRAFALVAARVVDVDIEAVLMRGVPRPERAALRPAEITDSEPRRGGMGASVLADHAQHEPDEVVSSVPAAGTVGPPVEKWIPREVVPALARKLDGAEKPSGGRRPERGRVAPPDCRCTVGFGGHRAGAGIDEPLRSERENDQKETRAHPLPVVRSGAG
jgi:hypothetical protein